MIYTMNELHNNKHEELCFNRDEIIKQGGIEKLDPQLQGQLIEALELLKDVVDEASLLSPNLLAEIKVAVWQIFES